MSALAETGWLLSAKGNSVREFYAAIGVIIPDRGQANIDVSCFANNDAHSRGDRSPSCSIDMTSGLWHCKACGEKGNAYQAALASGHTEVRARELARSFHLFLELAPKEKVKLPTATQLRQWRRRLQQEPAVLRRLAELKGWTPRGLLRCGVGWDGERLVMPEWNARGRLAGVVRYLPGGTPKTKAVPGSKRDLFPRLESIGRSRPVFLVEGEPAAVSVWSCGLPAVGIPGAGSWKPEWAGRFYRRQVTMLVDHDAEGRFLAGRIRNDVPHLRVVDMEPWLDDKSDVGDWVAQAHHEGGLAQVGRVLERLAA